MTTICLGKGPSKNFFFKALFSVVFLHALRVSYAGKNLLFIVSVCVAPCRDPILLSTWPLGFGTGVNDTQTDVAVGTIGTDVTYEQGPPGVGSSSLQFNGGADSYVDLRIVNRSEIWTTNTDPDFSFSMYLYVQDISNGTLLHYVSDEYSDSIANNDSDIKQFKVFIENSEIFVDYGADRRTSIALAVVEENQWFKFVFSRDASNKKSYVYSNPNSTRFEGTLEFDTLIKRHTRFPGTIRIGNAFNTIASASGPLIGRVLCLKMFAMKDPTFLCFDTDKDCGTDPIVTTTSTSTTTTKRTTTTTTATMLPTTTTTATSLPTTTTTTTTMFSRLRDNVQHLI